MKRYIAQCVVFFLIIGCKIQDNNILESPPMVITNDATEISLKNVKLNGEVINEGTSGTNDRGFVYSEKNTNPSVSDFRIQSGFGKGEYSILLYNLNEDTKYYVRAYATNSIGTSYGEIKNFTTLGNKIPTVKTDIPTQITHQSVVLGGTLIDNGGLDIIDAGICFAKVPNPTILDNGVIMGNSTFFSKLFQNTLTKIIFEANTKYFVRAWAKNSKGIGYGNEQIFSTLPQPESLLPTTDITKIVEVKSKTGRIWMDRNLGALQVAVNSTDPLSYGDLFQWGRGNDGHQKRTSINSNILSTTDNPGNSYFILASQILNGSQDWRTPGNENLWQGVNGINNVCPIGFRIPTEKEWNEEIATWNSPSNSEAAFNSQLKLPIAGLRYGENGEFYPDKIGGAYWSSTSLDFAARNLFFSRPLRDNNGNILSHSTGAAIVDAKNKVNGLSVRCIKN